jgi:hypothetical protein
VAEVLPLLYLHGLSSSEFGPALEQLAGRRDRDGVQTHRVGTAPLACRQSAHLVALVRAGSKFENGVLVELPDESTSGDTHAA